MIISDTFGRAWRDGHVNFAVGVAGMNPVTDYRGLPDAQGREMHVTTIAVADELAAAAELAQFKAIGVPVSVVRGYPYAPETEESRGIAPLLRERGGICLGRRESLARRRKGAEERRGVWEM